MPWVIHLAATGDEGFSMRKKHIAEPLLERGIASVILQIPFYGKRYGGGLDRLAHMFCKSLSDETLESASERLA